MKKDLILKILTGIVLIGLLLAAFLTYKAFRTPMAEPLRVAMAPTSTTAPAATAAVTAPEATATETTAATAEVKSSDNATCGISGAMTILMIGRDEHKWNPPYGADAIRMIKVDFSNKKVDVFAFPRDIKLQTPSLADKYAITETQLGPVYLLVREKAGNQSPETDIEATEAVAQVIYDTFQITPDHYITLEENVLGDIVDTVNGIQVDVPAAITYENIAIPAGEQMFNGEQAMWYSRAVKDKSHGEDEWNRFDRQGLVFKALANKLLLDTTNYAKLPDIYKQLRKSIVSDLSPEQVTSLICMAKDIPMENVTLTAVTTDQVTLTADNNMVIKDAELEKIREVLWKIFGKK